MGRKVTVASRRLTLVAVLLSLATTASPETEWKQVCKGIDRLTGEKTGCVQQTQIGKLVVTCRENGTCETTSLDGIALPGERLEGAVRWKFFCYEYGGQRQEHIRFLAEGFPDTRTGWEVAQQQANRTVYGFGAKSYIRTIGEGEREAETWRLETSSAAIGVRSQRVELLGEEARNKVDVLTKTDRLKGELAADALYGSLASLDREPSPIVEWDMRVFREAVALTRETCE